MGGYFNEFRREGVSAALVLELRVAVRAAIIQSGGDLGVSSVKQQSKRTTLSDASLKTPWTNTLSCLRQATKQLQRRRRQLQLPPPRPPMRRRQLPKPLVLCTDSHTLTK